MPYGFQGYGQPQDWNADIYYPIGQTVAHDGSAWRALTQNRNSEPTSMNTDWTMIIGGTGGLSGSGTAGVVAVWTATGALGTDSPCLTADPAAPADGFILYGRQIGGIGPRTLAIRYPTGPVQIISTE